MKCTYLLLVIATIAFSLISCGAVRVHKTDSGLLIPAEGWRKSTVYDAAVRIAANHEADTGRLSRHLWLSKRTFADQDSELMDVLVFLTSGRFYTASAHQYSHALRRSVSIPLGQIDTTKISTPYGYFFKDRDAVYLEVLGSKSDVGPTYIQYKGEIYKDMIIKFSYWRYDDRDEWRELEYKWECEPTKEVTTSDKQPSIPW